MKNCNFNTPMDFERPQTKQHRRGLQKGYDRGSTMSEFKSPALRGKGNAQFLDGSFTIEKQNVTVIKTMPHIVMVTNRIHAHVFIGINSF